MTPEKEERRTARGVPVTDDLIEELVTEAESGYDVAALRRRGGRRPLGSAPGEVVPVRLDPELRAELGRRGRLRVLDCYTNARIAEQTVEVYRAALAGGVVGGRFAGPLMPGRS